MNLTRILKVTPRPKALPYFVPQQQVNGLWLEFFGFDSDSPYLHPKTFKTILEAKAFLVNPSIWSPERNEGEVVS